jgi:CelD/BcsL family acetyltransferase involved in cellulose biosynthesis
VVAPFSVVEAQSYDDAVPFREGWDRLAKIKQWPFAELNWVKACAKHLSPTASVTFHIVLRANTVAAAIALTRTPGAAAPLTNVGADALYEATPLLSESAPASRHLIDHLVGKSQPLMLSRFLDGSDIAEGLREARRARGRVLALGAPGAPYLTLQRSVESFLKSLSANRRSTLNRKRRKLESRGALAFHSVYPDEEAVLGTLADFERLENAGWKGRRGSAIAKRPGFHHFFATALADMARGRRVRVDRLSVDGMLIAMQFGLVSSNRYFLIKPTYDEALKEHSPGSILTFEAIKRSIAEGLETYEFLGSEDPWKLQWTRTVRHTASWVYYPYSPIGLARFGLDAWHAVSRKVRQRRAADQPDPD